MIPACSTTIILSLSTKDLGGRGNSHNLFNASPSTVSPKTETSTTRTANPTTCSVQVQQLQLQIPQLQIYTCSTTIILLLSTKDLGGGGRSDKKGFHAVNSKQKSTNFFFSWFLPDVLTVWTILPKYSFINQRLG